MKTYMLDEEVLINALTFAFLNGVLTERQRPHASKEAIQDAASKAAVTTLIKLQPLIVKF